MKGLMIFFAVSIFSLNVYAINATHGMVLFGTDKFMAYHLPMYHKIHAYQVLIEFDVASAIKEKIKDLEKDSYLTFVPEPFDLEKFIAKPHPLKGDVYLGHFEKDGVVMMSDVDLVNPVILYASGIKKPLPRGTGINDYKLIGTPKDLYAVHLLNGGDQMDQIFKVHGSSSELAQKAIDKNVLLQSTGYELFKEGDSGTIYFDANIDRNDPNCQPIILRSCKISYDWLRLDLFKIYFSDSVM